MKKISINEAVEEIVRLYFQGVSLSEALNRVKSEKLIIDGGEYHGKSKNKY